MTISSPPVEPEVVTLVVPATDPQRDESKEKLPDPEPAKVKEAPVYKMSTVDMSLASVNDMLGLAKMISTPTGDIYAVSSTDGLFIIDVGHVLTGRVTATEDLPASMFLRPLSAEVVDVLSSFIPEKEEVLGDV